MKLFYAPLRALEQKFIEYVLSLQTGPEQGLLVLCPSERVAAHLQRLLLKHRPIIGNITFKTLGQLMGELDKQSGVWRKPLLPNDCFHDYLLKNLLLRPELNRYPANTGVIGALKASLRDLADAMVDPEILHEHWITLPEFSMEDEQAHLKWLIEVYRAYLEQMEQIPQYRSYAAYFDEVIRLAENSAYLHGFKQILVYGFYEFTGRQLELFHTLRRNYPLSVFWAYMQHPAFSFGKKFFESNILGTAQEVYPLEQDWQKLAAKEAAEDLFSGKEFTAEIPQGLKIISVADVEAELFFVAKEILRLHEEQGIAYEDMAVTARSMEPYKNLLPAVFEQNFIALNASFSNFLSSTSLGVFLHNLLGLLRKGFPREEVLAVVQSPYFKQKNKWRYLITECQAQRDFAQWTDLLRPSLPHYDPAFLKWLEETRESLSLLEKPSSWQNLCQSVSCFLEKNIDFSSFRAEEQSAWKEWEQGLSSLLRFSTVSAQTRHGEFLDELMQMFAQLSVHEVVQTGAGVTAVDVMGLRGLGFKVLFVLGLNEKNFPQVVREDPMLKDFYRRILRDQLGYWINQKMERFDEEKLLFFCALEAAGEKIYLSFLRADSEGKPCIVSGYLAEVARTVGLALDGKEICFVSGRKIERLKTLPAAYLTEKETSWLLAAQGADIEEYEKAGILSEQVKDSLAAARQIASRAGLNPYDGMVQSGEAIFDTQNEVGFSPSALKDLALCPMKYFFAKGLGLREKDEVFSRFELAPNLRGTIYHEILMEYYKRLYQEGLTGELFGSALQERLHQSLDSHYNNGSYKYFGIYPVIWELLLQDIDAKLVDFVVKDAECLEGFVPQIFETLFEKEYVLSEYLCIKLKGIVDRIDVDPKNKRFRVLDYKSSLSSKKGLAENMFRHLILQPFIYLLLVNQQPQTVGLEADGAALLGINKGYTRQELSQTDFEMVSAKAADFFTLLMGFITSGCFFFNPSEHCQYCPYQSICRKDNFRSLLRARHAKEFDALEEAKQ